MAEFTPIETQEQLDAIIASRLNREKTAHAAQMQSLNERIQTLETEAQAYAGYAQEKSQMQATIARYETDSGKREIAEEYNLPRGFHTRLQGDNADQWREDAQALQRLIGSAQSTPPLAGYDPQGGKDDIRDAYKKMTDFMEV